MKQVAGKKKGKKKIEIITKIFYITKFIIRIRYISPISFFFPITVMSVPAKVYPTTPVVAITIELINTFEFNSA